MAEQNTFHLIIASVGETRFDGAALAATLPTTDGEITVLPHHEPLAAILRPGTVRVKCTIDGDETFEIEGGIFECTGDRAVVLL